MAQLLACYASAGCGGSRRLVRVEGTLVAPTLLEGLMVELRAWSARYDVYQERPMIRAQK